jgi:hypothetical protein
MASLLDRQVPLELGRADWNLNTGPSSTWEWPGSEDASKATSTLEEGRWMGSGTP